MRTYTEEEVKSMAFWYDEVFDGPVNIETINGEIIIKSNRDNRTVACLGLNIDGFIDYHEDFFYFNLDRIKSAVLTIVFSPTFMWTQKATINKKISSYGMKHRIEKDPFFKYISNKNNYKTDNYLSNGELIIAMKLLGYKCFRIKDSLNCHFNVEIK